MGPRQSFVMDRRGLSPSEPLLGHPARAGPGLMPSPARPSPFRTTSEAPRVRRCLTRGNPTCLRSASDRSQAKFCHGPARPTHARSASGASSPRRYLTRGNPTCLRSASDRSQAKFCHGPARPTHARSASGASSPRRYLTRSEPAVSEIRLHNIFHAADCARMGEGVKNDSEDKGNVQGDGPSQ